MKAIEPTQNRTKPKMNIEPNEGDRNRLSKESKTFGEKLYSAIELCNRQIYEKGANSAFNLIISLFLLATMTHGNSLPSVILTLFCISTCTALTKIGEIAIQISGYTPLKARLPSAFVVGFTVMSLPMVILTYKLNMSALSCLLLCFLTAIGSRIFIPRIANRTHPSNDWWDTSALLVITITIAILARIPLSSNTTLLQSGVLPIWSDYFIHGITIATFGSPFANGGDMELAGVNLIFYHYAPFVIPAAFQTVSGMSGLALSTSLLLPLGLLIAVFGIYSFATELGGRAIGSVTLILIICIPAYSILIQSGWFNFYWLLLTAPGSGYAIGVSAVACALTAVYLDKRDHRMLCLVLLMLVSLVVIRVHMFLLLAPTIIAVVALQRYRANNRLLLGAVTGVIIAAFLTLQFSDSIHESWNKYSATQIYLNIVTSTFNFYGYSLKFPAELPYGLKIFAQIAATLAAVLGVYAILYPPFLWLHMRRSVFKEIDAVPLLLVFVFVTLIIFAPIAANGDSSEYKHRHFILLYVLFSIFTINYGLSLVASRNPVVSKTTLIGLGVAVLFITTITYTYQGTNPARPDIERMPWTDDFHNQTITPGLLDVSDYLRANARDGDVMTMGLSSVSSIGPRTQIVQILSLTGVPAFVARSELKMLGSHCVQEIVRNRLGILNELALIEEWSSAQKFLQSNGIRWYISTNDEKPRWDTGSVQAVFSSNGMSVYDAGTGSAQVSRKKRC